MAPVLTEEEAALDPYALLELTTDATEKDVQRAYRKKSLKCHPDRNASPEAAIQFRQISLSLEILINPTKRNYVDNKLENDRKKKERYAEMDKKRKVMVDALNAREEEAKRAKIAQQERRRQEAEEEAIKDAGKRMLEEAQKRAMAAASAATSKPPSSTSTQQSSDGPSIPHSNGTSSIEQQPEITSTDLTLILTFPPSSSSSSSSESLQSKLESKYGPIAHCVLTEPPPPKPGKKQKGKKAVVEFQKGNWGGCWACWKDHDHDTASSGSGRSIESGVKVKWVTGEVPGWIEWADKQKQHQASNGRSQSQPQSNGNGIGNSTIPNIPLPHPNNSSSAAPSFNSAPDFGNGGLTMSDLLKSHVKNKMETLKSKKQNEEFESMTLLRMRQLERERLEAQIRAEEEGDD